MWRKKFRPPQNPVLYRHQHIDFSVQSVSLCLMWCPWMSKLLVRPAIHLKNLLMEWEGMGWGGERRANSGPIWPIGWWGTWGSWLGHVGIGHGHVGELTRTTGFDRPVDRPGFLTFPTRPEVWHTWSQMPLWVMGIKGQRDEMELVKGTDGQVKQLEKKEERVHASSIDNTQCKWAKAAATTRACTPSTVVTVPVTELRPSCAWE